MWPEAAPGRLRSLPRNPSAALTLAAAARSIVLAKEKAAQMAEDAINNQPPAPAPDSEEAVAAAAAAAAQAAKVAEAARKAREQEEAYRTALETWEQDTSALRAAERERLLAAMVRACVASRGSLRCAVGAHSPRPPRSARGERSAPRSARASRRS